MKAACPGCGRAVQVRPCRGGDGSAVRVSRHKAEPDHAVSCSGSYSVLDLAATEGDAEVSDG
jgi:hypothetical protein